MDGIATDRARLAGPVDRVTVEDLSLGQLGHGTIVHRTIVDPGRP
ncbi:MAG: hypothetical protein ACYCV7_15300 [Acidimicrobiales bacterium]